MANVRVTVTGADQLARKLDKLGRDLKGLPMDAPARLVKRRAAQEAPKVTGRLSRDIEVHVSRPGRARVQLGRLPYGPPVHEGYRRRGIQRNRFIDRAARRERGDVGRSVRQEVRRRIRANRL